MAFLAKPTRVRQAKGQVACDSIRTNGMQCEHQKTSWIYNVGTSPVLARAREAGFILHALQIKTRVQLRRAVNSKEYNAGNEDKLLTHDKLINACLAWQQDVTRPDWIVAHIADNQDDADINKFVKTMQITRELQVIIVCISQPNWRHDQQVLRIEDELCWMKLRIAQKNVEASMCGAPINSTFPVVIAAKKQAVLGVILLEAENPTSMRNWLGEPDTDIGNNFLMHPQQQRMPQDFEQTLQTAQVPVMVAMDKNQQQWTAAFNQDKPAPSLASQTR